MQMNGTDCFFSALYMLISFLPDGESPSCLWFQHSLQLILMHDPEIHSQQKYGCQDPSHRTCHTDSKEALIMGCCKRRPASSDQFSDSGGHGEDAVAHPLYPVPIDIDDCKEYEGNSRTPQAYIDEGHKLTDILRDEQYGHIFAGEEDQDTGKYGVNKAHPGRAPESLPDPADLARACILCAVGRHGRSQCDIGLGNDLFDLDSRGVAGDCHRTQCVQRGLYHYRSDRSDRILECHGEPDLHLPQGKVPVYLPVVLIKMEQGNALYNIEETSETGYSLGDHGRVCGSCRTHMEYDDKYQVKQDVQERRQDQEIQRPFAVPDRTKDTCQQVIHYLCHDSGTDDHYVRIRLIEHIGRCIHPMQDTSHQDHACHSEHD